MRQLLLANARSQRRAYTYAGGRTIVINYLSTIIFFVMMAIGYLLLGRNVDPNHIQPMDIGLGAAWTMLSAYAGSAIKIAAQWEKALVFRLGKFRATKGPGVYTILPLFDQSQTVDTRVLTMDIPRQEAITKDNVPVSIDGVIFMQVVRPDQAIICTVAMDFWVGKKEFSEVHVQRAHSLQELVCWMEDAGFERVRCYDAFSLDPPRARSDRVHVVGIAAGD